MLATRSTSHFRYAPAAPEKRPRGARLLEAEGQALVGVEVRERAGSSFSLDVRRRRANDAAGLPEPSRDERALDEGAVPDRDVGPVGHDVDEAAEGAPSRTTRTNTSSSPERPMRMRGIYDLHSQAPG